MDVYWSVERCRWEPSSPEVDALATPWSMWQAPVPVPDLPVQRRSEPEAAPAEG